MTEYELGNAKTAAHGWKISTDEGFFFISNVHIVVQFWLNYCSEYVVLSPNVLFLTDGSGSEIIQLRKINGSSAETPSYQHLHRELLLSHKRGLLLEEKPELKRVLEQRRLELHREEEMAQRRPSDLETELRKRQQKLQEYEQEEIRQRENQNKIPEFVRVRENLRRTQTFDQP
uniref:Family with sequence similarity 107 member A n=1 Tax=Poecilia mexicana TaxID=48701 RepID=A0A3B3XAB6_9TELE